jgi:hypothetical protein
VTDGTPLGTYTIPCYYVPRKDSQVFLKGHIPKGNLDVALGILNKAHNVAVVSFPPKGSSDALVRPLSLWFHKLLDSWNIDGRVKLAGVDDAWDLYAGCLCGEGYTLAAACNNAVDKPRALKLQLNFLPPGDYAVTEVTGDPPDLATKPDGGPMLKNDPAARQLKINYQLSAQQIAQQGIPCVVRPRQAQVFLIRPLEPKVCVSIWKPWLRSFVQHPLTIAYGTGAADKAGAEAIRAALSKGGVPAGLAPATEIKFQKLHHDVRIDPLKRDHRPKESTAGWYLVDTFDNEVVDTQDNLIIVGSLETNELLKHLAQEGSFVYDKVLEKVTAQYPGPGRGVIGSIDSINFATYDLRSQARDAITVGGSDTAGTQAAVHEFIKLIAQYGAGAGPAPGM